MKTLRNRIADDPWDAAAWLELAHDMSQRDPTVAANLEEQRAFYDDMLARFPTAVRLCPLPRPAEVITPTLAAVGKHSHISYSACRGHHW